ncbi:InlB B-repeat-containing protein [Pontiella sulfatireligans]|uniref:Bacterial repeat domain-containing protein n=1 Tax=Pontiella sulfatireligans TaxID=2750658 RepID=A0A6C2UPA2_9BACT|nr:hypothetical protein [Pontiella sulfatireligans]VGO22028.1 hypothetical protein SCARR_04109 [Pontiella sulfatireligans]
MKKHILLSFLATALAASAVPFTNITGAVVDTRDYNLTVTADNGATDPAAGIHTYSWRSSVPCAAAAETNGWLFTGWSGDASSDHTQTDVLVLMDALSKAVLANYSDDPDGDGLHNTNEWAVGANPWISDTDGDGFDDLLEFDHNWNPTVSDLWAVDYIAANGGAFGLYPSNAVLDIAVGQMLIETSGGTATLSLQLEESGDLVTWSNAGPPEVWSRPVDGEKQFFRVRSSK